ncbi:MAG TPA: hypothetical protein VLB84_16135 [Bacteroidia bacterium]|nr:hypothetical protein [Bacteroidia bacterium]
MAIYRFKVAFEDNEDVYREIEIKSTQTFEDFHNTIVQSINFDNQHNASFYISDDYWRKGDEIVLRPSEPTDTGGTRKRQDTEVQKKQMSKCKMASLIDDPHQKFVYLYDPKTGWTFLVELLKIVPDDAKVTYPRIAKSAGEAPKQYKPTTVAANVEEEDFDDADDSHVDDIAYENAHGEDETALLESEEGEEAEDEELIESDDEGDASEFEDHAEENFEED